LQRDTDYALEFLEKERRAKKDIVDTVTVNALIVVVCLESHIRMSYACIFSRIWLFVKLISQDSTKLQIATNAFPAIVQTMHDELLERTTFWRDRRFLDIAAHDESLLHHLELLYGPRSDSTFLFRRSTILGQFPMGAMGAGVMFLIYVFALRHIHNIAWCG
jgi:hypothetical protein